MNWRQWRNYGYRSRLSSVLRCGPSSTQQQAENTQVQSSQEQLQLAQQQQELSSEQYAQYQKDIAPLESKLTTLSSGNAPAAISAAMPEIAQITGGFQAAQQNIMNTIPPGAARDAALANLQVQKATTTSGTVASEIQQAPAQLAALGSGIGGFSLQQLGASLSGLSGASTSAGAVAAEENQAQANKVGLVSGLAGAAGSAAGGAFSIPISDARLKTNIETLSPILDALLKARIVKFDYINGSTDNIGVIAQELQPLIPQAVSEFADRRGYLYVDYGMLAAAAIAGIQELTERVRSLEAAASQERAA